MITSKTSLRDRFSLWACNLILNHVATKWYRNMIGGLMMLGLESAKEKVEKVEKK